MNKGSGAAVTFYFSTENRNTIWINNAIACSTHSRTYGNNREIDQNIVSPCKSHFFSTRWASPVFAAIRANGSLCVSEREIIWICLNCRQQQRQRRQCRKKWHPTMLYGIIDIEECVKSSMRALDFVSVCATRDCMWLHCWVISVPTLLLGRECTGKCVK